METCVSDINAMIDSVKAINGELYFCVCGYVTFPIGAPMINGRSSQRIGPGAKATARRIAPALVKRGAL